VIGDQAELQPRNKTPPSLIYWAEDNFNPATKKEMTMFNTIKTALAAALIFGAASAAFANENEDNGEGGYHLGPMGQFLGGDAVNPVYHRSLRGTAGHASSTGRPGEAFGFAAAIHKPTSSHPKTHRGY
jgi:hypothetical protein